MLLQSKGLSADRKSVLIMITEDWFFASHFMLLARFLQSSGYTVSVYLRVNDPLLRKQIEESGIQVIASSDDRKSIGPRTILRQIRQARRVIKGENPNVVHVIGLRNILLGGIASLFTGVRGRVFAVTGLGYLGASRSALERLSLYCIGLVLRHAFPKKRTAFLFENIDDMHRLGFETDMRHALVGGAGIDADREKVMPFPSHPPLRVAVVSRMILTKGIAVAVEAVRLARLRGSDIVLTLVGSPDPGNPKSYSEDQLSAFAEAPGISWIGYSRDVSAVWHDNHVVCVPSLGGEGLPRSLLEGAAAGRPVVTTRTPGCSTFVRDGIEGLLVAPGNPGALAEALVSLAGNVDLVHRMGAAARARVLDGHTIQAVSAVVLGLYDALHREEIASQRTGH